MKSIKCEWHNFPIHGCTRKAKHFFMSLVEPSPGIIPRHRAVCSECYPRFINGLLSDLCREISFEKWKKLNSKRSSK